MSGQKREPRRKVWVDPLGARANAAAMALVMRTLEETREVNDGEGRYRDKSVVVDATASGNEKMLIQRGGLWNATDGMRVLTGVSPEDASRLAQRLRAEGVRLRNADADSLLMAAELRVLRLMTPPARPALERRKKAGRRERARAAGMCSICTTRPARPDRKTCQECSDAAAARVAAKRAAARGEAPAAPAVDPIADDGPDFDAEALGF